MTEEDNLGFSRRTFISQVAAGSSLGLGGRWAIDPVNARESENYRIGLPIERQWGFGFSGGGLSSPEITLGSLTEDTIYLTLSETDYEPAKIVALDRETHERRWEGTVETEPSWPLVYDERMFITLGSEVHAYNATSQPNDPIWEESLPYDFTLWPSGSDELVFVSPYNARTEQDRYGDVYHYDEGGLYAYDHEGRLQWSDTGDFMASPFIGDGFLYQLIGTQRYENEETRADSGRVVKRDASDGSIAWSTEDIKALYLRFSSDQNEILARTDGGYIIGIDTGSGSRKWSVTALGGTEDYARGPEHLFIGDEEGVSAVNPQTGSTSWQRRDIETANDIRYYGGLVFVGTVNGAFYAVDSETAETIWKTDSSGRDGYVSINDGEIFTVAQNWLTSHIGKRGKAIQRLSEARSTSGLGTVSASVSNLLGRKSALNRAEKAIEDARYDAAMSALQRAELTRTGIEAVGGLLTLGGVYSGSRVGIRRYRQESLRDAQANLAEAYPLNSGALAGLDAEEAKRQASVAAESLESTPLGPPIRETVSDEDEYGPLINALEELADIQAQLRAVSVSLAESPGTIANSAWANAFQSAVDQLDVSRLKELVDSCETVIDVAILCDELESSDQAPSISTKPLADCIRDLQEDPKNIDPRVVTYLRTAIETIKRFRSAEETLSAYDLDAVRTAVASEIRSMSGDPDSAKGRLRELKAFLENAVVAEKQRSELDLEFSDVSESDVRGWIEQALSSVAVEEMGEIKTAVKNLNQGVWKREHLHGYSPTEFEHLVAKLYSDKGYQTIVSQQSNDLGIDVTAKKGSEKLAIQVKQYSRGNRVGRPTVQQTAGAREQVGATKAVIVTSSTFTNTAKEASRDYGSTVKLIDGDRLRRMLSRSGLAPQFGDRQRATGRQKRGDRSRRAGKGSRRSSASGGATCMVCGQQFEVGLQEIQIPSGQTIRCCSRCKQLIEQSAEYSVHQQSKAYEILGVERGADQNEIQSAYREKVQQVHPDQGGSTEEFQRVQEAYETLSE